MQSHQHTQDFTSEITFTGKTFSGYIQTMFMSLGDGRFSFSALHCSCSAQDGKTSRQFHDNKLHCSNEAHPSLSLRSRYCLCQMLLLPMPSNQSTPSATQAGSTASVMWPATASCFVYVRRTDACRRRAFSSSSSSSSRYSVADCR